MLLGGIFALSAAATFACNNAAFRRGALYGSVGQAMGLSLPLGVAIFLVLVLISGATTQFTSFPASTVGMLAAAGILHFAWGRYCNFRATKAMGANLVGPPQQVSLLVTLGLAIGVLGETLTPMRVLGILLVVLGPAVALGASEGEVEGNAKPPTFKPHYVEGYTFALLSGLGYGTSPILVRTAVQGGGITASFAGGLIAYIAATAVMALILLKPGEFRRTFWMTAPARNWFIASGVLVSFSQMFTYLALAVAPVSVVTPIQRLSIVFRVFVNSLFNREHEVLGGRIWAATYVSLLGALALTVSTETVIAYLPLPDALVELARWEWP